MPNSAKNQRFRVKDYVPGDIIRYIKIIRKTSGKGSSARYDVYNTYRDEEASMLRVSIDRRVDYSKKPREASTKQKTTAKDVSMANEWLMKAWR